MLINGVWAKDFHPVQGKDAKGGFVRKDSSFRHTLGTEQYPVEAGRYHLIVALICPWASRVLAMSSLKGLASMIPVSIVEPILTEQGWGFGDFEGATGKDKRIGADYLHQFYSLADPDYTGRATVPILFDTHTQTIVNNESSELVKIFNSAFNDLLPEPYAALDLYPAHLQQDIDRFNEWIYPRINNGVYRTGFATTQVAYEEAVTQLFAALDTLEQRFSDGRANALGDELSLADIHLFPSLIRFDAAYHGAFKANLKMLRDYPYLHAYTQRIYDIPEIQATVNFDHIKTGYYSIKALNPTGIVPVGPSLDFK